MNGAIYFASNYGSTAQYANWIGEEAGLSVFDVRKAHPEPADYDFLILASPVIYFRLPIRNWVRRNLVRIVGKPVVMVTVSGAPPGPKLDGWISGSLPAELVSQMKHVALRGRQEPKELTWFDWVMLKVASLVNPDRAAGKQESGGFDFMDKSSIEPVLALVRSFQSGMAGRSDKA